MNITYLFIVAGLLLQQPAPREMPKLISIGKITKVEVATKSFDLTSENKDSSKAPQEAAVFSAEVQIGNTGGREPRRPGDSRIPGYDPFENPDATPAPKPPAHINKTKIFLLENTSCSSGRKPIPCTDLKLNDSVRVTGEEKRTARGKGIYATEVVRMEIR